MGDASSATLAAQSAGDFVLADVLAEHLARALVRIEALEADVARLMRCNAHRPDMAAMVAEASTLPPPKPLPVVDTRPELRARRIAAIGDLRAAM
jgi:hypothetical protein